MGKLAKAQTESGEAVHLDPLVEKLLAALLIGAVSGAITLGVLVWRVTAAEADGSETAAKARRNEANIEILDRQQREIQRDQTWANRKLDALLEAQGVTARIDRPVLPPSELKKE